MKIRSLIALAGLVIGFTVPTFAQQKDTPVDPKLTEQLIALAKKFDDAFNNNDAAAVAALFTKDGVMVTNSGQIYGPEAITKHELTSSLRVILATISVKPISMALT